MSNKKDEIVVRGMIKDGSDGKPVTGASARKLGVRVPKDIKVDLAGMVEAGFQGMSVSPMPIDNLPKHRRPPEFGGTGKDSIFGIDVIHLEGFDLQYVADPNKPTHGFIAPIRDMEYTAYEKNLYDTCDMWFHITNKGAEDENP